MMREGAIEVRQQAAFEPLYLRSRPKTPAMRRSEVIP